MTFTVFWDRKLYPEDGESRLLRNTGNDWPDLLKSSQVISCVTVELKTNQEDFSTFIRRESFKYYVESHPRDDLHDFTVVSVFIII
jgi:hypothetical protein